MRQVGFVFLGRCRLRQPIHELRVELGSEAGQARHRVGVFAFEESLEGIDLLVSGFKDSRVLSIRFKLSFPDIKSSVGGEEIEASGETAFNSFLAESLGPLCIGESHIQKNGAHFASESLKTRLPTDFFCP